MKRGVMKMALNDWEHEELSNEIYNSNMAQLLELFKREDAKLNQQCMDLVSNLSSWTETGRKEIEEKCKLLDEGRMKIALEIVQRLTDTTKFQNK